MTVQLGPRAARVAELSTARRLMPDRYWHESFFETERPDLARVAQVVQARGYQAAGFVVPQAVVRPEGVLHHTVDEARGPNVKYRLARNPDFRRTTDRASMRHVRLVDGISMETLPAFERCGAYLSAEGKEWLNNRAAAGAPVSEIASLAAERGENGVAVHEMFRHGIHDALGRGEVWVFSIVGKTMGKLVDSLGRRNFTFLGEPAVMDNPLISRNITLQPVALEPDVAVAGFPELYAEAEWLSQKDAQGPGRGVARRAARTILFYTDGLPDTVLSPDVVQLRQQLVQGHMEAMHARTSRTA